jgi:hypothetical protein
VAVSVKLGLDRVGGRAGGWDELAQLMVASVLVRAQELGEEVGLWLWGGEVGETLLGGVDAVDPAVAGNAGQGSWGRQIIRVGIGDAVALCGEKGFLFSFQVLGQVVEKGLHGAVHCEVVENDEDQEDDHQNQRADGELVGTGAHGEQTDQTDNGQVATDSEVLQTTSVASALGVDACIRHVQHVVPVSKVEQVETNGTETHDEGRDARVGDGYKKLEL